MTHPEWQTVIRVAQIAQRELDAQREQEEAAKRAERDTEEALQLKKALSHFGIQSDPTQNEWEMDGFNFMLVGDRSSLYNEYKSTQGQTVASFCLRVCKPAPPDETAPHFFHWLDINVTERFHQLVDGDWTYAYAWLADALDRISDQWDRGYRHWQESLNLPAQPLPKENPVSLGERLEALIAEIVRDELAARNAAD